MCSSANFMHILDIIFPRAFFHSSCRLWIIMSISSQIITNCPTLFGRTCLDRFTPPTIEFRNIAISWWHRRNWQISGQSISQLLCRVSEIRKETRKPRALSKQKMTTKQLRQLREASSKNESCWVDAMRKMETSRGNCWEAVGQRLNCQSPWHKCRGPKIVTNQTYQAQGRQNVAQSPRQRQV